MASGLSVSCQALRPAQTYAETHAGMIGILLKRGPAGIEIVTDLNPRIRNFWLTVRDRGDELAEKLAWTPYSEVLYHDAIDTIDEGDELQRAIKLAIVLSMSFMHGDGTKGSFVRHWKTNGVAITRNAWNRIPELQARVQGVEILGIRAVDLLRRQADNPQAVIYVDPPYRTADTSHYGVVQHDYEEMLEALQAQKGQVAVSGYRDEWDELGWQRLERTAALHAGGRGERSGKRTEVLWINYEPPRQEELI